MSDWHGALTKYAHTQYRYPITHNKREILNNVTFFFKYSLNNENEVQLT